jgi:serine/threonine-protein kinase
MDVCRALDAAHAQGVIHRDIKPGNIMLTQRGDVKVTDFGIARMAATSETVAQTAAVLGTASYLSPEQAQGQPVDGRTDIYSLGCVLYEMVTGRTPFLGDSPVAVASKHVLEQPSPPSKLNRDVSPDLDAVILRALAKNPANRYQSAEELRADLERVKRGMPVEATPLLAAGTTQVLDREPAATAVLSPTTPEPERSRWWIPVLVTLLILGVLGAVLFFLARSLLEDEDPGTTTVAVPDVVGDRLNAARAEIEDAGLVVAEPIIRVPADEDDPDAEPGTVLEQDPPADTEVDEGSAVTLTVVAEAEAVAVPTIPPGSTFEDAQAILLDAGLVPAGPVDQPSDEDVGIVIGTIPAAGVEVQPETEVTVVVSSGPEDVVVPDVRCQPFGAASSDLRAAGLNPVISDDTVDADPRCPNPNRVAAQDPGPGVTVPQGTTVTLFAGATPPPTGPTGPTGGTGTTGDDRR